ncbi:MAG: RNB domain-containing ribonuclease, partial [Bacteroidales bacterium]|nr:RNB domain-containing ribonuclease [Bacteroidales bacterium]
MRKKRSAKPGRGKKKAAIVETRKANHRSGHGGRHNDRHRHIPESLRQYITGKVDMKSSGKAYLLPDNKEIEDVFIAASHTNHAMDGDHVRVLLFPRRGSVGKLEGQIVEILQRNKNYIVGIVTRSGKYYFLEPDNPSVPVDIFLPADTLKDAKAGEKVVVRIVDWPRHLNNPIGEVIAVLGTPGDNTVEMQSILADYNFPLSYPAAAEAEAAKMKDEVTAADLKQRRDFRDIYTCTIDPVDAKDYDDALSFRRLDDGQVEVGVHIADVSHFVKPGSAIDQEAYDRATSVYLVDRTIAMLPERLSNDLCSLRADVERFSFSAVFTMNPETAEVTDFW